jgi:dTDP-4-amino-4,6-dideoxygalactose transaminase
LTVTPAAIFERGRVYYFWRGRVALYAILESLGIGAGDQVIVPGFTCVAAANAVIYSGAEPVYVDIEPDTYNVSRATIEPRLTDRTRAVVVQNSFGLSADLAPIMEMASEAGIPVVEDCAHGLGGSYRGRANGTVADAAFFSAQWSKPIPVGLGGIAYVEDNAVAERLESIAGKMPAPPLRDLLMLRGQVLARPLLDHPALYYPLISVYRWLTQKAGLPVGSSSGAELRGIDMPARYLQRMSSFQRRRWERGLEAIDESVARRRACAARYDGFFAATGITPPARPAYAEHAMLRYTVRVDDKPGLLERARRSRLPLGDWFLSPLHPVVGDLTPWGYEPGTCPEAERACRETVNLLTDHPLREPDLGRLFDGVGPPRRAG